MTKSFTAFYIVLLVFVGYIYLTLLKTFDFI